MPVGYRVAWGLGPYNQSGSMIGSLVAFGGVMAFFFWIFRKPGFGRCLVPVTAQPQTRH